MLNVLIIKKGDNEFERYYNESFKKAGYSVRLLSDFDLCGNIQNAHRTIKRVEKLLKIDKTYIRKFDLIIVFEDGGLIPFLRINGKKNAKIILWQWNIKEPSLAMRQRILKRVCQIWTFDPNDSKKYGWFLNSQFYSPEENAISPPYFGRTRKAFCACVDKGRYRTLKFIRKKLLSNGVGCDFLLVKSGEIEYEKEDLVWIRDKGISYSVFLKKTLESDLIVDLVQEGQNGLTVRSLEALFYNKKLITNNDSIREYSFYRSSNIYVIGQKDIGLVEFLERPFEPLPDEIKKNYSVKKWINNFVEMCN